MAVGLDAGLEIEREAFFAVMCTEDSEEGYTAFQEKRVPVYHGR